MTDLSFSSYWWPLFRNITSGHIVPDLRVRGNLTRIPIKVLKARKLRAIGLDVDSTICRYGGRRIDIKVMPTVEELIRFFTLFLISDGDIARTRELGNSHGIEVIESGYSKTGPEPYIKAGEYLGYEPREMGMIDDHPLTGIAGAKRAGLFTILVDPLDPSYGPRKIRSARVLGTSVSELYRNFGIGVSDGYER